MPLGVHVQVGQLGHALHGKLFVIPALYYFQSDQWRSKFQSVCFEFAWSTLLIFNRVSGDPSFILFASSFRRPIYAWKVVAVVVRELVSRRGVGSIGKLKHK